MEAAANNGANNGLTCHCCSEPLYFNNEYVLAIDKGTEIKRWFCCGKGMHHLCWEQETLAKGQSLEDHAKLERSNRCPLCTAHTGSFKKTGKIVTSLKKWAKKKKTWAVTDLALMTYLGQGVPKNEKKGIKMLEKAIAWGDANAMGCLGGMFYRNVRKHGEAELEPEQSQQMVEVLTRAASLNHPAALTDLGTLYWNGIVVDKSADKAMEYMSRAAKLHQQTAVKNLEMMKMHLFVERQMKTIKSTINSIKTKGKEGVKTMIQAISTAAAAAATTIRIHADCKTLNKAVEMDRVHQDRSLATSMVSTGTAGSPLPVEPDEPCFACSKTLPKDHCKIMRFMCCGRGMHYPCLEKTFKHLTEAYRKANDPMCPCCNTLYPTTGTDEEWAVLKEWTTKRKELSWPYCIMAFRIKAGYFKHASFYSLSLIKDNYEKAALLGNVVGMVNLGTLYGNGSHGVGQDLVKARQWWGQAAALDDETAICCLDMLNKRAKQPPPPVVAKKMKPNAKSTIGRVDYFLDLFFDWGFKFLMLLVMHWSVGVLWNLLPVHVVAGPLFEILPEILMVLFFLSFEILVVCFFLKMFDIL